MGGSPPRFLSATCGVGEEDDEEAEASTADGGVAGEESRRWASAMTASARRRECWRMWVLESRVEFRLFRVAISRCRVVVAVWREWDWEIRACAAALDCEALDCRVSVRVLETAWRRASFSGFGGIGGTGPDGVNEGSSTSKGDVRRSGVSSALRGAGGCLACGIG